MDFLVDVQNFKLFLLVLKQPLLMRLFLEIHAFHPVAHTGHHLVRDGVQNVCQYGCGKVGTEDGDLIALPAVYVRNVNHAYVHADVTHVFGAPPVD